MVRNLGMMNNDIRSSRTALKNSEIAKTPNVPNKARARSNPNAVKPVKPPARSCAKPSTTKPQAAQQVPNKTSETKRSKQSVSSTQPIPHARKKPKKPRYGLVYWEDSGETTIVEEDELTAVVLSVSKVLSNESGQSRCHLAGEKELLGSLVYMDLNR